MNIIESVFTYLRLAVDFILVWAFGHFFVYLKDFIELKNRLLWQENDSTLLSLINKYLTLTLEARNLYLSDIKWFSPKKFEDVVKNFDSTGKIAIVTGADQELGKTLSTHLAKYGLRLILGVSDTNTAKEFVDSLNKKDEISFDVIAVELDTSSLKSVRNFAKKVKVLVPKIDLLINCSELWLKKRENTEEGFEKQFAANYLGHFLLTNLLLDYLKKSPNGRVINVSALWHNIGKVDIHDLNCEKENFFFRVYDSSKLAQVLFNKELADKLKDTNVTTYAMSPNIIRHPLQFPDNDWRRIANRWLKKISDPMTGIQTILYLALNDELKNESGFYYNNCQRINFVSNKSDETSKMLWKISSELTGFEEQKNEHMDEQVPIKFHFIK